MLAKKQISQSDYDAWAMLRQAAEKNDDDREKAVSEVNELIENELELVGSTAIEDRLQDYVPETIKFMISAGIKVWVLTGDKKETAENIGYSCGLLNDE